MYYIQSTCFGSTWETLTTDDDDLLSFDRVIDALEERDRLYHWRENDGRDRQYRVVAEDGIIYEYQRVSVALHR